MMQVQANPIANQLRQYAEQIRQNELQRSFKKVDYAAPFLIALFEQFSVQIVNQLLHDPVRHANNDSDSVYVDLLTDLFDLV